MEDEKETPKSAAPNINPEDGGTDATGNTARAGGAGDSGDGPDGAQTQETRPNSISPSETPAG